MKLVWGLCGFCAILCGVAEAKYVFPKDHQVKSRSEEIATYQMKEYDEDGDSVLSLEEFEKR